MKKTSIGGQAVMEGVMMRNLDRYAVAVRKPDHEIEVMTDEYKSLGSRYAVLGLPIIRGVVNFGESLYIGLKTLSYSSSFYEEDDYEPGKVEQFFTKIFKMVSTSCNCRGVSPCRMSPMLFSSALEGSGRRI